MRIEIQITLLDSIKGVIYGLQKGAGTNYTTLQKQEGGASALHFTCEAECKRGKDETLNLLGPFCQGTPKERFLYIDIGTYSAITDSVSGGRLKIPLYGFSQEISADLKEGSTLQTSVSAIGKNGRPAYGTVKPFDGWSLVL